MKKRILKKHLKVKSESFLKSIDPSVTLYYHTHKTDFAFGFFDDTTESISLNLEMKMKASGFVLNETGLSLWESIQVTLAHEYGHYFQYPHEEYSRLYQSLFLNENINELSDDEVIERIIIWKQNVIKEENRAWENAKPYLKHVNQIGLKKYIEKNLANYRNDIVRSIEEFKSTRIIS